VSCDAEQTPSTDALRDRTLLTGGEPIMLLLATAASRIDALIAAQDPRWGFTSVRICEQLYTGPARATTR